MYHNICNLGFTSWLFESFSFTNYGLENIPKNVGMTKSVPKKYHGILFPNLVFILSLKNPTKDVQIPSAIYPESIDNPVMFSFKCITELKYHVR